MSYDSVFTLLGLKEDYLQNMLEKVAKISVQLKKCEPPPHIQSWNQKIKEQTGNHGANGIESRPPPLSDLVYRSPGSLHAPIQ